MTLKKCPCCKKIVTSKTAEKKGRDELALYFNCKNCQSTFILRAKNWEKRIQLEVA
jgi:hypothetical protein